MSCFTCLVERARGGLYFFKFLCYVKTYKMFSKEILSHAGQKKRRQSYGMISFYSKTSEDFAYKKATWVNCLLKCSQKEKPEPEKQTVSVVKQLSSEITRFFAGRCPMSGANMVKWGKTSFQSSNCKGFRCSNFAMVNN